jgi:uridine kinase
MEPCATSFPLAETTDVSRADLLEIVAERIDSLRLPHPVRVAVDGPDAAGKTTIADELLGPLNDRGRTVIRAGIDGWHRPQAVRYSRGALSPEGYYYDSFDLKALRSLLLLPLGPGGDRRYVSAMFDSRLDSYRNEPWREAIHDAVLVFDGVFLLRPELNGCWDFRILLHADVDEVVRRVRERDGVIFGSAAAAEERAIAGDTSRASGSTSVRFGRGNTQTSWSTTPTPPARK